MKKKEKIINKKIIVATHSLIYSASQALRDYIRDQHFKKLLYISHALIVDDIKNKEKSYCEISENNHKSIKKQIAWLKFEKLLFSSINETILTIWWSVLSNDIYDLYIGVDCLNALHGLFLKLIGKVDRVVYYTIDYFPTRFENKLLNWIYHKIDKICVKYCDETWNVSSVMVKARMKWNKMSGPSYKRQMTVPIGVWYKKAPRKPFKKIDIRKIIFSGHLKYYTGVDLAIKSLPKIIKVIPDIKLEIIGGGEAEKELRELAKKYKLQKYIKFWGWVNDRHKLENIMSTAAVGIAPFNTEILDEKVKNADPSKLKDYMLLGMPIIVTDAISNIKEISEYNCGKVIRYNIDEFSQAVIELIKDKDKLKKYRENAINFIKRYDYNLIFKKNLARVLNL